MFPRANSLGLIMKENHILLEEQEGKHSKGIGLYYRPIGGTIQFGERSDEALTREFFEELRVEIKIIRYLACLENIFRIGENIGHEITQLYLVEFKDKSLYQKECFTVIEGSKITKAKWIPLEDIFKGSKTLYPNGLSELLRREFRLWNEEG
jgi:ADP-ribose pyrophosphatase YjhB (NUDIX family)